MNVKSLISRRTLTRCKRTFVGAWLASLYIICVSAVIYSLSSFQIQNRLASIPKGNIENGEIFIDHQCKLPESAYSEAEGSTNSPLDSVITLSCIPLSDPKKIEYYTFGDILPTIEQNNLINSKINTAKEVDKALKELIDKTTRNIKNQQAIEAKLLAEINAKIAEIRKKDLSGHIAETRKSSESISKPLAQKIEDIKNTTSIDKHKSDDELNILKIADEANKQRLEEVLNILKIAAEANSQKIEEEVHFLRVAADENSQKVNNELSTIRTANVENINKLQSLLEAKAELLSTNHVFADILSNIEYYESFFEWVSKLLGTPPFWALPKSILTLLLVLSTGVLGSIIFVTVEFLKEPEYHIQNLTMYLFRPFLGMILALSMYVMLKAGQFTFVDDSNQNLSPFLVSFLGIISGMLAEEAYHRLTKTGGAMINGKSNGDQPTTQKGSLK
ncbi:hypothetical protein [Alkalimarinus sediminis]|uniref:Uncharacterized protein n=1 Tax=Alkalimarinus sediminis TaxID=1632866 RepID=A0A9E8KNU6_9ALTE|nr:hypothetical protein [Alkalimarinus sediminis]UZW74738.1 hypothetical protein NNL22_17215 [Alkalimarinus sediminis]